MTAERTPRDLAERFAVTQLRVRNWLRAEYPRAEHEKYQRWVMDEAMERRAAAHFGALR